MTDKEGQNIAFDAMQNGYLVVVKKSGRREYVIGTVESVTSSHFILSGWGSSDHQLFYSMISSIVKWDK